MGDGYQLTVRYTEFVTANGDKGVDVAIKTTPATGLVPAGMPTTLLRTLNRLIALSIVAGHAEDSDEGVYAFAHTYVMLSRKITRVLAARATPAAVRNADPVLADLSREFEAISDDPMKTAFTVACAVVLDRSADFAPLLVAAIAECLENVAGWKRGCKGFRAVLFSFFRVQNIHRTRP